MRLSHYAMWAVIAASFIVGGMLYRGQQDMIINAARAEGATLILKGMTPYQLTDLKI